MENILFATGMHYMYRIKLTLMTSPIIGCSERYLKKVCQLPNNFGIKQQLEQQRTAYNGWAAKKNGYWFYRKPRSPMHTNLGPSRGYPRRN
jgi:hypothetical protein